jgi:pyruvate formate lyase activating enzyme
MTQGSVFNLQRFSLQDGPGLRTTVFMKGCPLSCLWCHNPESQAAKPEILRLENRCMACGLCSEADLAGRSGRVMAAGDLEACPTGALQQVGRDMEPAALVRQLLRDRVFFDESGGGVTFSGGEPLMQAPFLVESLGRLRAEGVHTALDTCGFAPWSALREAAGLASLVLYDLKLMDDARHRAATGQSNRLILDNLEALSGIHPEIWIRVPIIPGCNDDEANLEAAARFLAPLAGIRQVDLLPYHRTGATKFARMGRSYALAELQSPTPQRMEALAALFRARGLATHIGGHP